MAKEEEKICERCGHPFNPHILIATVLADITSSDGHETKDVPVGGHMYCQNPDCSCYNTWSIPDEVAGFDVVARIGPRPTDKLQLLASDPPATRIQRIERWPIISSRQTNDLALPEDDDE